VSNEIVSHLDMLPTILAIAGDLDVKDKLLKGYTYYGKDDGRSAYG
jgi:arylsulfatase A-like enzyme